MGLTLSNDFLREQMHVALSAIGIDYFDNVEFTLIPDNAHFGSDLAVKPNGELVKIHAYKLFGKRDFVTELPFVE